MCREALEIGALCAVRVKEISLFERHVQQLLPYFYDFGLNESPRVFVILGLYLLSLLTRNRISEFHSFVERIGYQNLQNIYIQHPLHIERALMEGSYNKVFQYQQQVPAPEFAIFMEILIGTIRFLFLIWK